MAAPSVGSVAADGEDAPGRGLLPEGADGVGPVAIPTVEEGGEPDGVFADAAEDVVVRSESVDEPSSPTGGLTEKGSNGLEPVAVPTAEEGEEDAVIVASAVEEDAVRSEILEERAARPSPGVEPLSGRGGSQIPTMRELLSEVAEGKGHAEEKSTTEGSRRDDNSPYRLAMVSSSTSSCFYSLGMIQFGVHRMAVSQFYAGIKILNDFGLNI